MAFLDTVGQKLTDFGNGVSNKTKSMVEASNLNGQLKSCEAQLKNYYYEIGKMYYEQFNEETELSEEMQSLFAKADEAQDAIDHLYAELKKVKGTEICPSCRAEVALGTVFCSACGVRMDGSDSLVNPEGAKVEGMISCPECGMMIKEDSAFCMNCGTKI